MDYEQKYKELVGKVEKAYLFAQTDSTKAVLEDICPELKGSQDERIRKEIIVYLKGGTPFSTLTDKWRWINWLEKQGEKMSVVDFKANDRYASKVDGKIYNAEFMEKPANLTRKLEIENAAMSTTGIIERQEWFIKGAEWSDEHPSCFQIKKPAWSERDEKILNTIINDIQERHPKAMWKINDGNTVAVSTQYIIDWLEKQGEKPQGKSIIKAWKDMRCEVYAQASGNRHEPNCSDNNTEMFSLNDIDEIIEKIATGNIGQSGD